MLQYPLPLPPLSLRKDNASGREERERRRNSSAKRVKNENPNGPSIHQGLPAFAAFSHPHAPPPSSKPLSASHNLPHPSPRTQSRHFSFNKQTPPSPVPRSARPNKIDIPSFSYTPRSSRPSTACSTVSDILYPGDLIGEGLSLQGESVRVVPLSSSQAHLDASASEEPAKEFEVIRLLGTGSYAVVYHVREVLSRKPLSEDGHSLLGRMDMDDSSIRRPSVEYGREYAIKCLSKANLDEEALEAQTFEVCLSSSLAPSISHLPPSGHYPPVHSCSPQRCNPLPHTRDIISSPSSSRVCSRRGPILFFGTSSRSLRNGPFFRIILYISHPPYTKPSFLP